MIPKISYYLGQMRFKFGNRHDVLGNLENRGTI